MFRVKPRATLGVIFFTVLIQKSEKQWKVVVWKICPQECPEVIRLSLEAAALGKVWYKQGLSGKICHKEVPRVIRLSQGTQPRGKVCLPEELPMGKFLRQSLRTFHCLSDFWVQKTKKMRPRVAPWACLEKQLVWTCSSLRVLNSDFGS